ncbi:MAG: NYN domain-containing protein [Bacteroidetes bacterium]|nr:NYN domain-containing protein [Bacteroidota bacterium]MBU1680765.1 NYN domain-containing protein [Bacteroidota bacterium]MBU2505147.1 NYN domain-containing protein [Bacteroidota bacterium]
MSQHYIIDGNNLIGKIKDLWQLQSSDGQKSREKLVFLLDRYFNNIKATVSLHFDGFEKEFVGTTKIKVHYSGKKTADENIKREIDLRKNPKIVTIISSDRSVFDYAKKSSCTVIKAEDFQKKLKSSSSAESEQKIIESISNEEIKKLFGVK